MEIWLSWQNNKEKFQLPVPPSSFEVAVGNINKRININDIGEINLIGKSGLKEMTIESFFPANEYDFLVTSDIMKPYEYVEMVEGWRTSQKPIRVIFTDTPINLPMAIENFSYREQDGTGDVYFTLELAEYIFLNVKKETTNKGYTQNEKRDNKKEIPNSYIVKKGDTLIAIAKKLTGNSANWSKIAQKNNIKDPKKLQIGQKLVI